MTSRGLAPLLLALCSSLSLLGCSSSSGDHNIGGDSTSPGHFTIGGTVSGVNGYLGLHEDGLGVGVSVESDGPFSFTTTFVDGYAYDVSIESWPPRQECQVENGSGVVAGKNVDDIVVTCVDLPSHTLGGTVTGLNGDMTLADGTYVFGQSSGNYITLSEDGPFVFEVTLLEGEQYDVQVLGEPSDRNCEVQNGVGTMLDTDINDVLVICTETVAPSIVSISPEAVGRSESVVIVFDESMNPDSFDSSVTELYALSTGANWSMTTVENDTLTLSPAGGSWFNPVQGFRDITLQFTVADLAGNLIGDHLIFTFIDGAIYFASPEAADDSGDGLTPASAKQTIAAAIEAAVPPAVVVAVQGEHLVSSDPAGPASNLVLREGVSLLGGFGVDFAVYDGRTSSSVRDLSTHATGDPNAPNCAVEAGSGVTSLTYFDAFQFIGSVEAGADYTAGAWFHDGGAPTFETCDFDGGGGSLGSYGLLNDGSTIDVSFNDFSAGSGAFNAGLMTIGGRVDAILATFTGGSGDDSHGFVASGNAAGELGGVTLVGGSGSNTSTGFSNPAGSKVALSGSQIDGGSSANASYGIVNGEDGVVFEGNLVSGGAGATLAVGLDNSGGLVLIRNNGIVGGVGTSQAVGIRDAGNLIAVHNNLIIAGDSSTTAIGIDANGVGAKVRNNSISTGLNSTTGVGIRLRALSATSVDNNIVFNASATTAYCIEEMAASSDPAQLRNNDLFDCNGALYLDYVDGSGCGSNDLCLTSIGQVNALGGGSVVGNVSADPAFTDAASDFTFTSGSPASVTAGGLNGTDEGWIFDTDVAGNPRPASGVPWAMGAFEP